MIKYFISMTLLTALLVLSCGDKQTVSRDHIPVIKERFYTLQEAVKDRDTVALDSLVSDDMLDDDLSFDSLFRFVYGADGAFAFDRFGEYEIFYTNRKARVDCYIQDSTLTKDRPAVFTFVFDDDRWLLKRFEAGHPRKIWIRPGLDSLLKEIAASSAKGGLLAMKF